MRWILMSAVAAAGLYAFHRLATLAAARGWVYYRNRPRRGYSLGFIEEVFQPTMEFVIEETSSGTIRADQARSGTGDPPVNGPGAAG